jgi:hypothetical protein
MDGHPGWQYRHVKGPADFKIVGEVQLSVTHRHHDPQEAIDVAFKKIGDDTAKGNDEVRAKVSLG